MIFKINYNFFLVICLISIWSIIKFQLLALCPKFWIKIKLLWFHQDLTFFFLHVWDMWAIWSFLTLRNYPLHKYYIQRKSNLTCDKPIWEIYYFFFLAYPKFYINVNIVHPLDISLSSKVVCGAHKHAIKLVFVDSLVYGIILFLAFCCDNILHCLTIAYAKKWQVLESQGEEGNYAFFKLIFLSLSKCLMVLGIDVLKICIVKTWFVFSILICMFKKFFFKLPLSLPKKKKKKKNLLPFHKLQYLFRKAKHNLPYARTIYIYYDLYSNMYQILSILLLKELSLFGILIFLFKNGPTLLCLILRAWLLKKVMARIGEWKEWDVGYFKDNHLQ